MRWPSGATMSILAFAPYNTPSALVLSIESTISTKVIFVPEVSRSTRHEAPRGYQPNPPAVRRNMSGISVWEQALCAGDPACGTYAVALESDCSSGSCVFWMSVGNDAPAGTSATSAVSVVKVLRASGLTAIMTRHSESWLELWPASFLSVAQAPEVAKLTNCR